MLKMEQPPGMYMKTQATMTKCPVKNTAISRKFTNCVAIDSNLSGFLAENVRFYDNSGEADQKSAHRSSTHRRSMELVSDGLMI
jgi:hypothetical protein